jgi:hypothetical protein
VPWCGLGLLAVVRAGQRQGEALGVAALELVDIRRCRIGKLQAVGAENALKMPDTARQRRAERPVSDYQRL